ncbi:AI-2E family transporter [Granulicella sp. 5B5]|uniref:AI-2E family transporter n=1 Tax=Granulicella sp. 5B5 TaxID=1617967 RepID=UPI0015F72757|nr:AI-2E family transporter [Granulicella sp. 5B5]QMV19517.1 AI-2E family transporter [Granulicella sp. 5B5]
MIESNMEQTQTRRVRGHILFAFAVALGLMLAWRLRSVLELVYVSALFAVVLMPIVQRIMLLRIRGWSPSRPVAIVALVAGVFLALTLFLVIALPPVLRDLQHFGQDLPQRLPGLLDKLKRVPMANKIGVDSLAERAEAMAAGFARYVVDAAPELLGKVFDVVTAFILCIYFMLEGEFAYYYFLSLFRDGTRERLARTLMAAEQRMSKWLLGQGALMLTLGLTSTLVFAVLHVRYFVLLGVLMGLFNIIPVAGGVMTILLASGVAALDSWTKMAGVLIFYLIYTQVENGFLVPKIMRSSVNLVGLAVLIALLAGSTLAGVVGALVAVPTAALVAVLMDEYLVQSDMKALEGSD